MRQLAEKNIAQTREIYERSKDALDAVLETYRRAGQRAVLDYILNQINRAHGVHDADQTQPDGSGD